MRTLLSIRFHAEHGNEESLVLRAFVPLFLRGSKVLSIRSHAEHGNEVTGAEHGAEVTGGRARLFLLARRVAGVHLLWDLCELCGLFVLRSHAEHGNEVTGGRARLFLLARRVAGVHLLWDLCELCGLVVLRSHAEHGNEVTDAEHGNEVKMQQEEKRKVGDANWMWSIATSEFLVAHQ